jgi:hypothetical protein
MIFLTGDVVALLGLVFVIAIVISLLITINTQIYAQKQTKDLLVLFDINSTNFHNGLYHNK